MIVRSDNQIQKEITKLNLKGLQRQRII